MTANGEALRLAVRSGCRRAFLDEGEPGRALLQDYLDSRSGFEGGSTDDAADLARQLVASLSDVPTATADPGPPDATLVSPMVESLSDREREVLGMLLAGLTTKEVAVRLTISINTAKAHIKSVFRKLGIHRRTELKRSASRTRSFREILRETSSVTTDS